MQIYSYICLVVTQFDTYQILWLATNCLSRVIQSLILLQENKIAWNEGLVEVGGVGGYN